MISAACTIAFWQKLWRCRAVNRQWLHKQTSHVSSVFETMNLLNWQCWVSQKRWSSNRYSKLVEKNDFISFWWPFWQELKWKSSVLRMLCVRLISFAEVTITAFEQMTLKRLDALSMNAHTINCFCNVLKTVKVICKNVNDIHKEKKHMSMKNIKHTVFWQRCSLSWIYSTLVTQSCVTC